MKKLFLLLAPALFAGCAAFEPEIPLVSGSMYETHASSESECIDKMKAKEAETGRRIDLIDVQSRPSVTLPLFGTQQNLVCIGAVR